MTAFDRILALIIDVEGGLSLDPGDSGNWTGGAPGRGELRGTRFGISAARYPTLDIASLTLDAAAMLYRHDYWDPICGDQLPEPVALVTMDPAVNQGVGTAARLLQQSLGTRADGVVGPVTVAAARRHSNDPRELVTEITARRALLYAGTANVGRYGLGWMRRATTMMAHAIT